MPMIAVPAERRRVRLPGVGRGRVATRADRRGGVPRRPRVCALRADHRGSGHGSHRQEPLATLAKHRRVDKKVWFGQNLIPDNPGATIGVGDTVEVIG